jgi:hypothetical protein
MDQRNPHDLKLHPALKDIEGWSDTDPDFLAFCDDVKARGVLEPLLITADGLVIDGRQRWRAAKRWQIDVPVRVLTDHTVSELFLIQLATLFHRRHYTPSQRAFIGYPALQSAHQAALENQIASLKKGQKPLISSVDAAGVAGRDQLAALLGISHDTFTRAAKLHALFAAETKPLKWDKTTLKRLGLDARKPHTIADVFRPQILDKLKPIGLGAALAGIASRLDQDGREANGQAHGGGVPEESSKQLELFGEAFDNLRKRFTYWQRFEEAEKKQALKAIRRVLAVMPDTLIEALDEQVRAERKQRASEEGA